MSGTSKNRRPSKSGDLSRRPQVQSTTRRPENGQRRKSRDHADRGALIQTGQGQTSQGQNETGRRRHGSVGTDELAYYGINCCRAIFSHRPEQIIRVYLEHALKDRFSDLLKYCAKRKLAYHLVDTGDLNRFTGSMHHEGVCILAPKLKFADPLATVAALPDAGPLTALFLDGVENPHNIGALLRTAAHFGVHALFVRSATDLTLPAAACRIAEGGAELIPIAQCTAIEPFFRAVAEKKVSVAVTSSRGSRSLYGAALPPRVLFALGNEGDGISPEVEAHGSFGMMIPGTGEIESLNVSVAGAVLLAEHWRSFKV